MLRRRPRRQRQIAVNDFKSFDFVLEKTSSIAELICRYALVEELTLRFPLHAAEKLRRAMVRLYAHIMAYLAGARVYFLQSTTSE